MNIGTGGVRTSLWEKLLKACGELLITFSPFLVLILVLWFTANGHTLLERADLAFLMAVLFADGVWRVIGSENLTKGQRYSLVALGMVGALLCTASATTSLFNEVNNSMFPTQQFVTAHVGQFNLWAYISAVVYSITARTVAP